MFIMGNSININEKQLIYLNYYSLVLNYIYAFNQNNVHQ